MQTLLNVLAGGGGILGVASFLWRVWDEFGSYLSLELEIKTDVPGYAVVISRVENRGLRAKKLSAAYLLLGPYVEGPTHTYNKIAASAGLPQARYTDDILSSGTSRTLSIDGGGRQLIPLPFFTHENVRVGDEKLACSVPIKLEDVHYTGPFSVRLLVTGNVGRRPRMHRSVHDVILVAPSGT